MKILECSSNGDRRFSAFYAYVDVNGKSAPIEYHYQDCKRKVVHVNSGIEYAPCRKGEAVDFMVLGGRVFDIKFLTPFYKLMWVKYLDAHPELVKHASGFDNFSDMFKGKSINCQADVIREYIKQGRGSIMNDPLVREFIGILK